MFEDRFGFFGEGVGCGGFGLEGELFGVGGVEFCEHGDCGAGGIFESGDDCEACLCFVVVGVIIVVAWLLVIDILRGVL